MTTRIYKWVRIVCRGLSCISPFLCWVGIDKQCPYKQSLGSRYFLHSLSTFRPQRMPTPSTVCSKTYCAAFQIRAPFLSTSNHYDILSFPLACRDDPWGVPVDCARGVMDVPTGNHSDQLWENTWHWEPNVLTDTMLSFKKELTWKITFLLFYFITFYP